MRVTVLGASAVRPNPGKACSGYLLEAGGRRCLVDCGSGVLSQLLRHVSLDQLETVLITHAHPDHCLDLVNLRQALAHGPGPRRSSALPVFVGPGVAEVIEQLGAVFGDHAGPYWSPWIAIRTYDPEDHLEVAGIDVTFAPTKHYLPCWAMRFEHGGRVFVFTADTGPSEPVAALAQGAHLIIAEATMVSRNGHEGAWGHLSAEEAGGLAREAGAEQLVLTHYFVEEGVDRLAEAARAACDVPVRVAQEGERYVV